MRPHLTVVRTDTDAARVTDAAARGAFLARAIYGPRRYAEQAAAAASEPAGPGEPGHLERPIDRPGTVWPAADRAASVRPTRYGGG